MKHLFATALMAVGLLMLAASPRLHAATIEVTSALDDGTGCTLREALAAIEGAADGGGCVRTADDYGTNDTITFVAGPLTITLGSALPDITKDLMITGNGAADTIVQASDCDPVAGGCTPAGWRVFTFTGGALVLKDMTVRNGNCVSPNPCSVDTYDAGNIYTSGSLTLDGVHVERGNSDGYGGGVYGSSGSLVLQNGTVVGGSGAGNSTGAGGGLYVSNVASLTIDASTVSLNHAMTDNGGGVYFDSNSSSTLTIANGSLIDQNTAANDGGGIYLSGTGSSASITDSTVSGNTVDGDNGAGIYVNDSTLLVDNSRITSNTAYDYAGGIELNGGSLTIQNGSMIDHNAANIDYGGGINAEGSGCDLTIDASTISDNTSVDQGGAIWTGCTTNISASTFSGNMSGTDGGGIYSFAGATTTISNSTFSGNMATGDGGGIYGDGSPLSVINVTLSGNSGTTGGGISSTGANLTLKNSILANSLSGADCYSSSALAADVNNLVVDNSGCGSPVSTADPMLGPLADNGGPTYTMTLPPDSPAVDAGDDTTCAAAPVNNLDQRGLSRLQGLHCDIGAFEFIDTIFKDGFEGTP